jgi:hypothetical protein
MHPMLIALAAHERSASLQTAASEHRRSHVARDGRRRAKRAWRTPRAARIAHA